MRLEPIVTCEIRGSDLYELNRDKSYKLNIYLDTEINHEDIYKLVPKLIVTSKASDLIFKIVIFHDVPQGPQLNTQGFPELFGGGGGGDFVGWT